MRSAWVVAGVCGLLVSTAAVSANPGGGFSWSIQDTGVNGAGIRQTDVAMRNDLAWPVILFDGGVSPNGNAVSLLPAGLPQQGYWRSVGAGLFPITPQRLQATSSPDGRVAFVAGDPFITNPTAMVSGAAGGWTGLPMGTRAVAFGADGTLYTATSTSVAGAAGYKGGPIVDIAVSPTGEIGVVDSNLNYWHYSGWAGAWLSATLNTPRLDPLTVDLEFDALGRPHVVGTTNGTLYALDFSTIQGTWTSTVLATQMMSSKPAANLAADSQGTVGTAWVDATGMLMYGYRRDDQEWASTAVSPSMLGGAVPGIAYDYNDLPVISYVGNPGGGAKLLLAYDPIVVPEPASLMLLGASALLLARRARRA